MQDLNSLYFVDRLNSYLQVPFWLFVDLEKGFDRVLRDVIRWAMRKLGVEELAVVVSIGSRIYVYWCENSCKNS